MLKYFKKLGFKKEFRYLRKLYYLQRISMDYAVINIQSFCWLPRNKTTHLSKFLKILIRIINIATSKRVIRTMKKLIN